MKTKVENKKQDTYTANLKIYQFLVYLRKSKKQRTNKANQKLKAHKFSSAARKNRQQRLSKR